MKSIKKYLSFIIIIALLFGLINSVPINASAANNKETPVGAKKFLFGDIDENGEITIVDLTLAIRDASGTESLSADKKILADVNGNGIVDEGDTSEISSYIVGNTNTFTIYSLLWTYGYCGENVKYMLKKDGVLTVFGEGEISDCGVGSSGFMSSYAAMTKK